MKLATVGVLLASLVWGCLAVPQPSPILVFPGISNSALDAVNTGKGICNTRGSTQRLWIKYLRLLLCGKQEISLVFNEDKEQFEDSPGVNISVPSFGGTESVEFLGLDQRLPYLQTFLDYFTERGYTRGENIRTAPYDWRLAADELDRRGYFEKVKLLIEEMYKDNNKPVSLVGHSMGGLVSHHFLTRYPGIDQQWKDKHVHAWVTLSGAWSGGVLSLARVISGNQFNILDSALIDRLANGLLVPILRTLQSIPWLFPRETLFADSVLISTPSKDYTAADYKELFATIGYNKGYKIYQNLIQSVTPDFPAPGVRTHCYYGVNVPTPETYVYSQDLNPRNSIGMSPSEIVMGDGDGTVNLASSKVCHAWGSTIRQYDAINHGAIINDPIVLSDIALVTQALPPASLLITDD